MVEGCLTFSSALRVPYRRLTVRSAPTPTQCPRYLNAKGRWHPATHRGLILEPPPRRGWRQHPLSYHVPAAGPPGDVQSLKPSSNITLGHPPQLCPRALPRKEKGRGGFTCLHVGLSRALVHLPEAGANGGGDGRAKAGLSGGPAAKASSVFP